jgi:signal peptidase I
LCFPRAFGSFLKEFNQSREMEENTAPPQERQPTIGQPPIKSSRLFAEARAWVRDILFAFATAIFIVVFVIQPVKVEGTSMQPQLVDQERIFVNRFIYRFTDIHRSDIVVFWYPRDKSKSFIKRIIGLPGDEVEIRYGAVYVNGAKIEEPYLKPEFRDHESYHRVIVDQDRYFVLGDHRNSSNDSRNWGLVPRDLIYGKAVFGYWPMSHVGPVE